MILDLQRLNEHRYIEIHTDIKADTNMRCKHVSDYLNDPGTLAKNYTNNY